jgi:predicted nuclease of predicted toxin-antitoxin system
MKVLLDENLDHRLRTSLGSHECFTTSYKGWAGLKNGRLLDAAEADEFDVLLTGDQTLYKEQNLVGRRLSVVAMSSVEWHIIKHHLIKIIAAIDEALPGCCTDVDCGTFSRKKLRLDRKIKSISEKER